MDFDTFVKSNKAVTKDGSKGSAADKAKQEKALAEAASKASEERVGKAAEALAIFMKAYGTDYGLTEEELVASIFLQALNCRYFYPPELGGVAAFDKISAAVTDYFENAIKSHQ